MSVLPPARGRPRGVRGALCRVRRMPGTDRGRAEPSAGRTRIGRGAALSAQTAMARLALAGDRSLCRPFDRSGGECGVSTGTRLGADRAGDYPLRRGERACRFRAKLSRDSAEPRDIVIPGSPAGSCF